MREGMRSVASAVVCGTGLLLATAVCGALEPVSLSSDVKASAGGDLRIRQEHFDEIPIIADPPGITRSGENSYYRIRPRLWAQLEFPSSITMYGRVVNEFRHFMKPDNDTMDWPDELIVDSLYLDAKGLLGGFADVRIGRQDLIYGSGKLILDGTAKDGSRTIYHDAIRVTMYLVEGLTCDLLGIYNQPENQLAIHSQDRDLTGFDPAFNDVTESGGGAYLKSKQLPAMPWEAYYLYKRESDGINRRDEKVDGRDVHTVGARLMPSTPCGLFASLEVAGQTGETDDGRTLQAWMTDASLIKRFMNAKVKPGVGVGVYHISGDDPETGKDEGWNPLWARWPQYSELYVYAFDAEAAGRWSNVTLPYLTADCIPSATTKLVALVGPVYAPQKNGPGGGDERGWLGTIRFDVTLAEKVLTSKDKLFGHLILEVFEPGDYYKVDNTAHFARWELSYAF
jgi:hypothetical protein